MLDRPGYRVEVLRLLFDLNDYADDLSWDSRFIDASAPQEILDDRERHTADALFRYGIALPVLVLVLVLAYRVGPWWLLADALPAWLLVLSVISQRDARRIVVLSAAAGQTPWPALDRAVEGKPRYRTADNVIAIPRQARTGTA